MKNEFPIKIWLIGDHKVGKSSFIYKFVLNEIPKNLLSTIGLEKTKKNYYDYEIELWDTAGREEYRVIIPHHVKQADIIFLCFDFNNYSSFIYLQNNLIEIKKSVSSDRKIIFILLGMKCEYNKDIDINLYKEISTFIKTENLLYSETSIYYNDDYIYKELNFNTYKDNDKDKVECITFRKENFINQDIGGSNIGIDKVDSAFFSNRIEYDEIFYRGGVNVIIEYAITSWEKIYKPNLTKSLDSNRYSTKRSLIASIGIERKERALCCGCINQ